MRTGKHLLETQNAPFGASCKSLKAMAGTTGLEPAASAVTGQRSNQLNYVPNLGVIVSKPLRAIVFPTPISIAALGVDRAADICCSGRDDSPLRKNHPHSRIERAPRTRMKFVTADTSLPCRFRQQ